MLLGLPGKLTIRVPPRIPATPRESIQWRVCGREAERIASGIPGASRSITTRVASGVMSVGPNPVPPVVSTRSQSSASLQLIRRAEISSRSSGITSRPAISAPSEPANRASASPLSSPPSPAAREVEIVRIAARTFRTPSLDSQHHVTRLDHGGHVLPRLYPEFVYRLHGHRCDEPHAADIELHVRNRLTGIDVRHLSRKLV